MSRRIETAWLAGAVLLLATNAQAQSHLDDGTAASATVLAATVVPGALSPATTLKQAFLAAWRRQPEAQSRQARAEAASAHRQAANSWTPEPPSLELAVKSDRLNPNLGSREIEAAVALPLWLPGERARTFVLADAHVRAGASAVLAAQLRTAARVRESYWQWQRTQGEHALALERLGHARQLAADVAKRFQAGDLARADQHQAEGAVANTEALLAEAVSATGVAFHQLRALTGAAPVAALDTRAMAEPMPEAFNEGAALDSRHAALAALIDRADVARRAAELALVQTRSNPEMTLALGADRGSAGEPYQQSMALGIRIPLGSDSRSQARRSTAQAELIEAEVQLDLDRTRLQSEVDSARSRLESAQTQAKASDQRAQLARESLGFFQKSYRLGETDLPTRLRIELDAAEAQRQASRARIELAAAVSNLRQALGLLPE